MYRRSHFRYCQKCGNDQYDGPCNCDASSPTTGSPLKRNTLVPSTKDIRGSSASRNTLPSTKIAGSPPRNLSGHRVASSAPVNIGASNLAAMKELKDTEFVQFSAKVDCDLSERRLKELNIKKRRWDNTREHNWVKHYAQKIAECENQLSERGKKLMEATAELEKAKAIIDDTPKRRRLFH